MSSKKAGGFTLIELLVVVLIVGIIISIALIMPGSRHTDRKIREASERLTALFNAASERAVLSDKETGFSLNGNQYQWWERNKVKKVWNPLDNGYWKTHIVSADIRLTMSEPDIERNDKNDKTPDIVFYTDGTMTPVQITFSYKDGKTYQKILKSDGVAEFGEQ